MSIADLIQAYANAELARQEYGRARDLLQAARRSGDQQGIAVAASRVTQLACRTEELTAAAERLLWSSRRSVRESVCEAPMLQ